MKYDKIVSYFNRGEEGLNELVVDYKDIFNQIDDYGQQLLQGIITDSEGYKNVLNFMTGAYVSLEPLYSLAEAHKLNEELKSYIGLKREGEAKGEKVVATHLDKESSLSVANERRIRNVLEGYVLATEKAIVTCQTQLKRLEQDEKYKPSEKV